MGSVSRAVLRPRARAEISTGFFLLGTKLGTGTPRPRGERERDASAIRIGNRATTVRVLPESFGRTTERKSRTGRTGDHVGVESDGLRRGENGAQSEEVFRFLRGLVREVVAQTKLNGGPGLERKFGIGSAADFRELRRQRKRLGVRRVSSDNAATGAHGIGRGAVVTSDELRTHSNAEELSDDTEKWIHNSCRYGRTVVRKLFVYDFSNEHVRGEQIFPV